MLMKTQEQRQWVLEGFLEAREKLNGVQSPDPALCYFCHTAEDHCTNTPYLVFPGGPDLHLTGKFSTGTCQ